jgi:uncharacterized membrane protein YdjX (TVP38/TMEM64 family)
MKVKLRFTKPQIRFFILLLFIISFVFLGRLVPVDKQAIDDFLKRIPLVYSSAVFAFLYIAGTFVIWYLKDPLKIVGAIVFGAYVSTLLIYVAEIVNASIFFHLSNILGKEYVEKSLKGRFGKFYEGVDEINLGWIFMLRAIPLVPYRILDIVFGLSKVPFRKYILVVVLASLPRIFWIQFILAGIKGFSIGRAIDYFNHNMLVFSLSFVYFLVTLIVAFRIKRKFQ